MLDLGTKPNSSEMQNVEIVRSMLQEYYGSRLKTKADLNQKACCVDDTQKRHADILELIPSEVKEKYYGCGCPIPAEDLKGLHVLDLGCGTGLDVFILSRLVGSEGRVFGIDMTDQQIEVAMRHTHTVMERFGYRESNVHFYKDFIEVAKTIPDESIDLVVSNCVINLSPLKDLVMKSVFRVLKEGGEFYISDIVADRRVPDMIRNDPQMVAECLGGAEYENDWLDLIESSGFPDPRRVTVSEVQRDVMGEPIAFYSTTLRGFKFSDPLDRRCEDYGQIAVYQGNMSQQKAKFVFDDHHVFEAQRPTAVCRNTARMLSETRLAKYFHVTAPIKHFGLFPCGPVPKEAQAASGPCC